MLVLGGQLTSPQAYTQQQTEKELHAIRILRPFGRKALV